jgi:hypothetical protein
MKMRVHKVKKVRCNRQPWVDSGAYANEQRKTETAIAKWQANLDANIVIWRAEARG